MPEVGDGPEMLKRYAIDPVVEVVSSLFLKLATVAGHAGSQTV